MNIQDLLTNEELRHTHFPVTNNQIFLAHAGVTALPLVAADALRKFAGQASLEHQETGYLEQVDYARKVAAKLIGANPDGREIALLGPTSLGLNLVANGIDWQEDDQVVCYGDDYPANVYPWLKLASRGVHCELLEVEEQGRITWEKVEEVLTGKTRLVSLATTNFVSGTRIDIEGIGKKLQERGILFCVDGIQTLGAFPLNVEYIDFLSADSHKWMLGPVGAGIFYVKEKNFALLEPTLLGSWNVVSPEFIAQHKIEFYEGARRYESGTLNLPGIAGMTAAIELLLEIGVENIAKRLRELKKYLMPRLEKAGFKVFGAQDLAPGEMSGITTFVIPKQDQARELMALLQRNKIIVSIRQDRAGQKLMRVSPHFYNTEAELDKLVQVCSEWNS